MSKTFSWSCQLLIIYFNSNWGQVYEIAHNTTHSKAVINNSVGSTPGTTRVNRTPEENPGLATRTVYIVFGLAHDWSVHFQSFICMFDTIGSFRGSFLTNHLSRGWFHWLFFLPNPCLSWWCVGWCHALEEAVMSIIVPKVSSSLNKLRAQKNQTPKHPLPTPITRSQNPS